jgi:hypothetical protein
MARHLRSGLLLRNLGHFPAELLSGLLVGETDRSGFQGRLSRPPWLPETFAVERLVFLLRLATGVAVRLTAFLALAMMVKI